MRSLIVAAVSLAAAAGAKAQAAPASDVYLAPLVVRNGEPVVGIPVDITRRTGYDNQPSFTPDGRSILFTSIHEDGQADIYRYDLPTKRITRVTNTMESEYSPTVMPGGRRFSVIRVEKDSTQRLWSFRLDGSDPKLVLANIKPVGYHAWVDDHVVALFVLGDRAHANALLRADVRTGYADTLARDIGRSLVPLKGAHGFSFVQHRPDSTWGLVTLKMDRAGSESTMTEVDTLPRGADFVAWITPTIPLAGTGSKLFAWNPAKAVWVDVADLASAGLSRISRLAVSPDGKWLAIVADDQR